jgi:hypothetical protein
LLADAWKRQENRVLAQDAGGRGRELDRNRSGTYAHAEGTAKIIKNDPRAGIAGVIHFGGYVVGCWDPLEGSRRGEEEPAGEVLGEDVESRTVTELPELETQRPGQVGIVGIGVGGRRPGNRGGDGLVDRMVMASAKSPPPKENCSTAKDRDWSARAIRLSGLPGADPQGRSGMWGGNVDRSSEGT